MVVGLAPLRLLTAVVVGQALVERRRKLGVGLGQQVVAEQRVRDQALAARNTRIEAQQAHEIGAVGMEPERRATHLVTPDVRIIRRLAAVLDITQHVAERVLSPRDAKVHTDTPVNPRRIIEPEAVDRQTRDAVKATAVDQLVGHVGKDPGQRRQRKVLLSHVEHLVGVGTGNTESHLKFSDLGVGQVVGPHRRVAHIGGAPLGMSFERPDCFRQHFFSHSRFLRSSGRLGGRE